MSYLGLFITLRTRQNGRRFLDSIFKCIFLNENVWISIKVSLQFIPKGPINNIPALVQIMAWCRVGAKPLSETMMVILPAHICVTWPQWVILCLITYSWWWMVLMRFQYFRQTSETSYCHVSFPPDLVGRGTKVMFVHFSVSKILNNAKVPVSFFESHSYLTGVPVKYKHDIQ